MYVDVNTIYKYIIYMTVTAQRGEIDHFKTYVGGRNQRTWQLIG